MMISEDFFASIIFLTHPLFDLERDLEVCYLSVDDSRAIIFTKKGDNNWIFFLGDDFCDFYEKKFCKGLFQATMYPSLGRKKYQWIEVEPSEKVYIELDSLRGWIQNWSRDVEHYEKAKVPVYEYRKEGIRILEIHGLKSEFPGSNFNYYIPVYYTFKVWLPKYVDSEKFAFFWGINKEDVFLNIHDKDGPIVFGILPNQISAMLFPTKKPIRDIFEYQIT